MRGAKVKQLKLLQKKKILSGDYKTIKKEYISLNKDVKEELTKRSKKLWKKQI